MATTLSLDDIREQTRIRYGSAAKTLFVTEDGTDPGSFPSANKGERPTDAFKTVWGAIQQRTAAFASLTSVVIAFDGLQLMTVDNPDYWGFSYDHRNIIVPSNTRLMGASPATSRFVNDAVGSASSHVVAAGGDDVLMENFSIRISPDNAGAQLPIGFNAQVGATPPSKRVRCRNLLIDAFSDGFWFKAAAPGTVADWIIEDCIARTNYDVHTILGNNNADSPELRIDFRNCDFIARGPATFTPFNICRAVTSTNGTTILRRCNVITETTGGATNFISSCYARAATGQTSRIELYNCNVQTRVPAGYVGTNNHLQTDAGCTIIAQNVSHDKSKDVNLGTMTYINSGSGGVGITQANVGINQK